jgi:hypothetical protein
LWVFAGETPPPPPPGGTGGGSTGITPSASNTGPAAGTSYTLHTGNYVPSNSEDISGAHITGDLYLGNGSNVSGSNFIVDGLVKFNQLPGGNYTYPVRSGHRFDHFAAKGLGCVGLQSVELDAARLGGMYGTFAQLSRYADAPGGSPRTFACDEFALTNSLVDRLLAAPGGAGHYEAFHLMGMTHGLFRNTVFRYEPPDSVTRGQTTGVFTMETNTFGIPCSDIVVDGCEFYGGAAYQVYIYCLRGIWTNNKHHSFAGTTIQRPPSAYRADGNAWLPLLDASGNTIDGQPLVIQNA